MRIEYPNKVFLPCMAYQMNLIVGEIFKASDIYQQTSIKAVKIVSYFHSSAYFMGLLRNEQKLFILKIEAALKTLATKFALECLEDSSASRSGLQRQRYISNSTKKFLSSDIIAIINDPSFWIHLYELQDLILPLCAALNKLQKDMARLCEVVLAFGWDLAKGDAPELSQFALHLYGICVNSASVERLWSNMGFLHLKRRNRLDTAIEQSEKLYKQNHIAAPIQPHKTSDISDEENENDAHTQPMGMVEKENIDHSGNNKMGPDFIAVDHTIHPADDPLAKWNLYSIFNNSLESSVFVNAMINLNSN
ncbi:ribonuclease H-like domain-containing protein [Rhizophagus clarus]|uniref:Ribonuclease H-like domain-containing protein n=1 Tax=Rhizophagus clarus TaxID=94130 RepID=A0A8H3LJW5_9GLOM|nr:ribonuclease H-like domain-containing protein [Rhizophagus clarus]